MDYFSIPHPFLWLTHTNKVYSKKYFIVVILVIVSVLTGVYEGFFFGAMNIESKGRNDLDIRKINNIC